jgi:3-dehydroquinate synthase
VTASAPLELRIDLGERSYPILIGPALLDDAGLVARHVPARDVLVVTNQTVGPLYLARLEAGLAGKRVRAVALPDGEQYKNLQHVSRVLDVLIANAFGRDCQVRPPRSQSGCESRSGWRG